MGKLLRSELTHQYASQTICYQNGLAFLKANISLRSNDIKGLRGISLNRTFSKKKKKIKLKRSR